MGRVGSIFDTTLLHRFSKGGHRSSPSSNYTSSSVPKGPEHCEDHNIKSASLSPRIVVTPEINSVGEICCTLWVAIEITGIIQSPQPPRLVPDYLYSMQIDLVAGRGCTVLEIIGNLYELKTIHLHETHLILVKVRLPALTTAPAGTGTSEDLIEDLENRLGNSFISYLTVRLTYEHTAFNNLPYSMNPDCGLSFHATTLRTEATAYIRRTYNSAWAPRNATASENPLINLIEAHYTGEKIRDAVRKLAEDRVRIPRPKKDSAYSSETNYREDIVKVDGTMDPGRGAGQISHLNAGTIAVPMTVMDPARKIWTEMRRTSQSRHFRKPFSQDIYDAIDNNCSPSRISSGGTIDEERHRIRQVALKNKRSVGADTLRSIAPSVRKSKGGSVAGGLGLGRSWGWGGSWW